MKIDITKNIYLSEHEIWLISKAFNELLSDSGIENLTSDPGTPVDGQIWLRTDL